MTTENKPKPTVCVICEEVFTEWGNNPAPVSDHGRCCDECNAFVLFARLRTRAAGLILLALLTLSPGETHAQQATVYGPDGRVTARTVTGSNGATTVYGADGRVSARTTTSPTTGTTTVYGADGNKAGSIVPDRGRK